MTQWLPTTATIMNPEPEPQLVNPHLTAVSIDWLEYEHRLQEVVEQNQHLPSIHSNGHK